MTAPITSPKDLSEAQVVLCVVCLLLVPVAVAGLALMNAGLGRLRNASHSVVAALCAVAVSVVAFVVIGHSIAGWPGGPGRVLSIAGKSGPQRWEWIGAAPVFFGGTGQSAGDGLIGWLGLEATIIACLIPLGAIADRWRLAAIAGSTAISSALVLPLFNHWTWGGGWLGHVGENFGLGAGFLDAGGSGAIHMAGGIAALSLAWIIGPRRGRYSSDGMPMAIPGHNSVFVVFGCLLALPGWMALNLAGAILFAGAALRDVPSIALNTLVAACGAALAAAGVTRAKYGKPDASLTANGWTAGIAAVAAGCAAFHPASALLVGLVAGGLVTFAVELLDLRLEIDDAGGSIPVHLFGGLWGVLALGLFGRGPAASPGQFLAQVVGSATLLGFVLPLTWGLYAVLNQRIKQRVDREGEFQGMDLHELGAGAYPEFATHSDDFTH